MFNKNKTDKPKSGKTTVPKQLVSALKTALKNELHGHAFYGKVAMKSGDEFTKNTFENLAADEIKHIRAIEDFIKSNSSEPKFSAEAFIGRARPDAKMTLFGENMKKFKASAREAQKLDLGPYKMGMQLEKKSFEFYKNQLASATGEETRKFFKFLMEQEELHYNILKEAVQFLERPWDYLMAEEGFRLDGAV